MKYGNSNARRKLSEDDIKLIRALWEEKQSLMRQANRVTLRGMAEKFDVSKRTIESVVYREKWTTV